MIKKLDDLLKQDERKKMKLVVVASQDEDVLEAVIESSKLGLTEPILIGDGEKTKYIADRYKADISSFQIINECDNEKAAEIGVKLVSSGQADYIMKGLVDTSTLLKAVLDKEWGLRTNSLLSHIMIYEVPTYDKLLYLTDGGMNLLPSVDQKQKIIENAAQVAKAIGCKEVKVAVLAAKEKVDPKMQATIDADELKNRYLKGEFSENVIVDGPMALDLALSKESARIKNFDSIVAGDADILMVPNIEMGNGIGKCITYLANGKSAGIIMGARVPIVLVSRADDYISKLYSIALGSIVASKGGKINLE